MATKPLVKRYLHMEYLEKLPKAIPTGKVLVHNQVIPATRWIGSRGFRAWLSLPNPETLEVCRCGWAPELGIHYRVRAAWVTLPPGITKQTARVIWKAVDTCGGWDEFEEVVTLLKTTSGRCVTLLEYDKETGDSG